MTTKIRIDNQEAVKHLRDLVGADDLFPYADYNPTDSDIVVSITIYRRDVDNPSLKRGSREFIEDKDGPLSTEVRQAIFNDLWKVNPNTDVIEKLKKLGIEIVYPESPKQRNGWLRTS